MDTPFPEYSAQPGLGSLNGSAVASASGDKAAPATSTVGAGTNQINGGVERSEAAPGLPKVAVTIVTNEAEAGLAVKAFWQDAKTRKIQGRAAASIHDGKIETREVADLVEFIQLRQALTPRQALVYGVTGRTMARLVSQRDLLTTASSDAVIARTREFFDFMKDGPGVLMLDFDVRTGHPPRHWKELDAILCEIFPGWRRTARAWTQSSTSSLRTIDGADEIGMGGWRAYVIVDNANAVPDVGAFIYQAAWSAGYGYCKISKSGQILDRSLTDVAVHQPERIDFAGPPHLGTGLERTEVETVVLPGTAMLETGRLKPKQSMAEWRKISRKLKAARRELKGEANKVRATFEAAMFADVMKRKPHAKADAVREAIRRAAAEGELAGQWPLHLHDGRIITVTDLFSDPDKFDGLHCADPIEPDVSARPTYRLDLHEAGGRRGLHLQPRPRRQALPARRGGGEWRGAAAACAREPDGMRAQVRKYQVPPSGAPSSPPAGWAVLCLGRNLLSAA